MDDYTDEVITEALEWAIRKELINRAVALCFLYYSVGEFTAVEASNELSHYHRQVLDWDSTKELPGWEKDSAAI